MMAYERFVCSCQEKNPDEDCRLQLIVKEKHYQKYQIDDNGNLEYIDSDADQELYLECPICGTHYELNEDLIVEEVPMLRVFPSSGNITSPVTLEDLDFNPKSNDNERHALSEGVAPVDLSSINLADYKSKETKKPAGLTFDE